MSPPRVGWTGALVVLLLFGAPVARALSTGDPMPPLEVEEWVQGKTDSMAPWGDGNVYLVDLWGTWCMPCIALMPKLSDLQDKYRDRGLVVVGYSWEPAEKIRKFVAQRAEEVRYALATDSEERTLQVLAEAEAVEGFPYAFLVDEEGIIRWKGSGQSAEQAVEAFFAARAQQ